MACGSCGQRARGTGPAVATSMSASGGSTLYKVVLNGGEGNVAYQTNNVDLARKVRDNYPGSVLDPDPDAAEPVAAVTKTSVSGSKTAKTAPAGEGAGTTSA